MSCRGSILLCTVCDSHLTSALNSEQLQQAAAYRYPGGGGGDEAMVLVCLPLAAPIGLSPLHILTLCGSEGILVVPTEPLDDLSCLTPVLRGRLSQRRAVARAVDQVHPDAHSESMLGLPTPALTWARWCVHLQDHFPDRGF